MSSVRQWMVQFFGILLLALTVWAFLNTPDQRAWQVGMSALLALVATLAATWLIAANLGGSTRPPASRLPLVFGCLLLTLFLLLLLGVVSDHTWDMTPWLASALSLQRKKPVAPQTIAKTIFWVLLAARWILLPLLLLPLAIRASGSTPVRFVRFAPVYLILFLFGAVLPHYIVHWVPRISGLWPELLSLAARFLIAYALFVSGWVALGRLSRAAPRI